MSPARIACLVLAPVLALAAGCREEARCVERSVGGTPTPVVECSTGKVAVCGDVEEEVYDPETGALLRVPSVALSPDGSCPAGQSSCRPRPTCAAAGDKVACANGRTAYCVLGMVREIMAPRPMPDAGPRVDAGMEDGGASDGGGDTDGGDTDGGGGDGGGADAGSADAGTDGG
ncbi:MAG: hypothetical protein AB7S26_11115 [Sandaracinaceae bacterium]